MEAGLIDMRGSELAQFFAFQWALVVDAPLPFILAFTLGLIVGSLGVWMILHNRLKRHRELIAYFKKAFEKTARNARGRR